MFRAALVGAAVSGAPSTFYAVATGRPLLETTEAAGTILLPNESRLSRLVPAAAVLHLALSLFWAHTIATVFPRRRPVLWGSVAGLAIAIFDLRIIGRRWARIRALAVVPQLADHMVFGVVVTCVLQRAALRPAGRRVGTDRYPDH